MEPIETGIALATLFVSVTVAFKILHNMINAHIVSKYYTKGYQDWPDWTTYIRLRGFTELGKAYKSGWDDRQQAELKKHFDNCKQQEINRETDIVTTELKVI